MASTEMHAAFITADSSAWTCGRNQFGQLGDGTTIDRLYAIKVMDNVLAVAANGNSTYFIKSDNSLWVCGANITLPGSQAAANYNRPVKIADSVAAISTFSHTLFIKLDSTLWGFGPNYQNQLGDNVKVGVQAEPVKLMDGVLMAATGDAFSVIIKEDHSLWGTGLNSSGALGTNNIETLFRFTKVLDGVQDVSVGYQTTLIIKDDGTLWGRAGMISGRSVLAQ
ncbi:hypothetical protein KRR40_01165 [Niabella defluvii]|nr:hypothetical protein KRR40_01165 [Niabella sp. I65]